MLLAPLPPQQTTRRTFQNTVAGERAVAAAMSKFGVTSRLTTAIPDWRGGARAGGLRQ